MTPVLSFIFMKLYLNGLIILRSTKGLLIHFSIFNEFLSIFILFRRKIIDLADVDKYCKNTIDPTFKGVVFQYLTNSLYSNQQNFKSFTYKICRESLMTNHLIFYFRKSFYLVDEINERIRRLRESGIINYFISKYADEKYQKVEADDSGPSQLTVNHFIGIFQFLTFGLSVSFISLIFEIFFFHIKILFASRSLIT